MFHCAVLLNMVKLGVQKNYPDETWSMNQLVGTLCNRRYTEKTVAYAQSHDQSIVGAQLKRPQRAATVAACVCSLPCTLPGSHRALHPVAKQQMLACML